MYLCGSVTILMILERLVKARVELLCSNRILQGAQSIVFDHLGTRGIAYNYPN
jgi:hypothetical protein